jgi:pimeloyl-ACP methyl ester carboxylesterase
VRRRTASRHEPATRVPAFHRGSRSRRVVTIIASVLFAVVVLGATGFFTWAKLPMAATASSVAAVAADSAIDVTDRPDTVVMRPADTSPRDQGLVFLAGARVDPQAYEQVLSGVVRSGVTVIIVRPVLGFGLFDWRALTDFTSAAPEISHWAVGGHSLGGVRACGYAESDPRVDGLVLFGSYCATTDLSGRTDLPVLSLGGSEDGLSTPDDIERYRDRLPPDAAVVQIEGSNHAQFGAYGDQAGDGTATLTDEEARVEIDRSLRSFFAAVGP